VRWRCDSLSGPHARILLAFAGGTAGVLLSPLGHRGVLEHVRSRWVFLVLILLLKRTRCFNELQRRRETFFLTSLFIELIECDARFLIELFGIPHSKVQINRVSLTTVRFKGIESFRRAFLTSDGLFEAITGPVSCLACTGLDSMCVTRTR
jgi:hypothetical protein